jgi:hypothetical protein
LEKWLKIEVVLNSLIERLGAILISIASKLTPKKVSKTLRSTQQKVHLKREKITQKIQTTTKNSGGLLKLIERRFRIIFFGVQEKISSGLQKTKATGKKLSQRSERSVLLSSFFGPYIKKLKKWWAGLKPETVVLFFTGITIGGLTVIGLLTSGSKLASVQQQELAVAKRSPASQGEGVVNIASMGRPEHHKMKERMHQALNVSMPIFVTQINQLKTAEMDLTILSSNRTVTQYFTTNERLVFDRLNTYMEPIDPDFTYDDEGKEILQHKIREELNLLIEEREELEGRELGGHVQQIWIHRLLFN